MKRILLSVFVMAFSLKAANSQEIPIATDPYGQNEAIVVHDGAKFFVSYIDRAGDSYAFNGKFVSHEGVVSSSHQLVAPHEAMSFMHNTIAGDEQFLIAWSRQRGAYNYQRDAYARLIDAEGTPQGGGIRLSENNSVAANFIRGAFDGENYLVIWQEGLPNQGKIKGQLLSPQGTLVGSNFLIRPSSLGDGVGQVYPDIVFDGQNYAVVWDDNRTGQRRVYGMFIDTDGQPVGEDFLLGDSSPEQMLVQLAHNGTNYLAVWGDGRDGSKKGVYGQLFAADGSLIGSNIPISPLAENQERSWPRIGTNGNQYLVAWNHQTFNKSAFEPSPENILRAQMSGVDIEKSVIWYKVYGRLINSDGSFDGEELPIGVNDFHQQDPNVAGHGDKFLTAWQDSRNNNQYSNIYGMLTTADGEQPPVLYPPQNLILSYAPGVISLQWDAPQQGDVLYYNIYRNEDVLATEVPETSFDDNDAEQGSLYEYYVTAVYAEGESEASNTVEITIPVVYVDITFIIMENQDDETGDPVFIEGAKITLENEGEEYSDQDGVAVFANVFIAETIDYTVEKEGYYPAAGTLEDIVESMEITVLMQKDYTGVNVLGSIGITMYPNPANSFVKVSSESGIREILMIDITGKTLMHQTELQKNRINIDVGDLPRGVYILTVTFEDGSYYSQKLVVDKP